MFLVLIKKYFFLYQRRQWQPSLSDDYCHNSESPPPYQEITASFDAEISLTPD